jgi:hypothetical protein
MYQLCKLSFIIQAPNGLKRLSPMTNASPSSGLLLQLSHQSAIKQKYSSSSTTDLSDTNLPDPAIAPPVSASFSIPPEDAQRLDDSDNAHAWPAAKVTAVRSYKSKKAGLSLPFHQPPTAVYSTTSASEAEDIPLPRPLLLSKSLSSSKTSLHSQASVSRDHRRTNPATATREHSNDFITLKPSSREAGHSSRSHRVAVVEVSTGSSVLRRGRSRSSVASARSSASDKTLTNSTENLSTTGDATATGRTGSRRSLSVAPDTSRELSLSVDIDYADLVATQAPPTEYYISGAEPWNIAAAGNHGDEDFAAAANVNKRSSSRERQLTSSVTSESKVQSDKINGLSNIAEKVLRDTKKQRQAIELLHSRSIVIGDSPIASSSNNNNNNSPLIGQLPSNVTSLSTSREAATAVAVPPKSNSAAPVSAESATSSKHLLFQHPHHQFQQQQQQRVSPSAERTIVLTGRQRAVSETGLGEQKRLSVAGGDVTPPPDAQQSTTRLSLTNGRVSSPAAAVPRSPSQQQSPRLLSLLGNTPGNHGDSRPGSAAGDSRTPSTPVAAATTLISNNNAVTPVIKTPGQKNAKPTRNVTFHDVVDTISLSSVSDISALESNSGLGNINNPVLFSYLGNGRETDHATWSPGINKTTTASQPPSSLPSSKHLGSVESNVEKTMPVGITSVGTNSAAAAGIVNAANNNSVLTDQLIDGKKDNELHHIGSRGIISPSTRADSAGNLVNSKPVNTNKPSAATASPASSASSASLTQIIKKQMSSNFEEKPVKPLPSTDNKVKVASHGHEVMDLQPTATVSFATAAIEQTSLSKTAATSVTMSTEPDEMGSAQDLRRRSLQIFQNRQQYRNNNEQSKSNINNSHQPHSQSPVHARSGSSSSTASNISSRRTPLAKEPTPQASPADVKTPAFSSARQSAIKPPSPSWLQQQQLQQQQQRKGDDRDSANHFTDSDYMSNGSENGGVVVGGQPQLPDHVTTTAGNSSVRPWYATSDTESVSSYSGLDTAPPTLASNGVGPYSNGRTPSVANSNSAIARAHANSKPAREKVILERGLQISRC